MNNMRHRWHAGTWYWWLYAAVAAFLHWGHWVHPDEGATLMGAWQVSQGLIIYRDWFDYLAPGAVYLLGAVFWAVGATYVVAKLWSLLLLVSAAVALSRIGAYLGLGRFRYWPPAAWLLLTNSAVLINYQTYALVAAAWSLERLLWASRLSDGVRRWPVAVGWLPYALAGMISGLAVLFHQVRGAAVIFAGGVWLISTGRWRALSPWFAGIVLALLPLLAWPLATLWANLVVFPLHSYVPFARTGLALWFVFLVGYGVAAAWAWRRQRWSSEAWLVWLAGVLFLLSNFSRADTYHLLPALFPAVLLAAVEYRRIVAAARGYKRWIVRAAFSGGVAVLAVLALVPVAQRLAGAGAKNFLWLRDLELDSLVAYIQAEVPPDECIFAAPYFPNFYFETKRCNSTRFNELLLGLHPEASVLSAARDLAARPPRLVLLNYYPAVPPERFSKFLIGYPITDFVRQHYDYAMTVNGVQIYRRR